MAALTTADVLARVKPRVVAGLSAAQRNRVDFDIAMLINGALERVARKIADSDNYRLLRKDFTATPVAGAIDLSTISGILPDSIIKRGAIRLASGTTPIIFAETMNDLLATSQGDVIICCLLTGANGAYLRFRDTAGSITAFVTAVILSANYVPTLAQLPDQHQNDFIDILVELFAKQDSIIQRDLGQQMERITA